MEFLVIVDADFSTTSGIPAKTSNHTLTLGLPLSHPDLHSPLTPASYCPSIVQKQPIAIMVFKSLAKFESIKSDVLQRLWRVGRLTQIRRIVRLYDVRVADP